MPHHSDDRPAHDRGQPHAPNRASPAGTAFLDLEITEVLKTEARSLAREAVRDIFREAMRERLSERLGPRLRAIAEVTADALADEVETNLQIEALIQRQRSLSEDREEQLKAALDRARSARPEPPAQRTSGRRSGAAKRRP